jgi:PAS domain S-box-containing protein/putative nucleotidyltransferase with HDIG domain
LNPTREPGATNSASATPGVGTGLRRRAEEQCDLRSEVPSRESDTTDVDAVLHELRVHQIELEMQNEELRRAELGLDAQREKYFHLFDLAPVGYLTLSAEGIVIDANLTAVRLLRVERQILLGQPFSAFVLDGDRDALSQHLRALEKSGEDQNCELRLRRVCRSEDGEESGCFWARLESRPQLTSTDGMHATWVTFADITARKQAEEALLESEDKFRIFFDGSVVPHSITRPGGEVEINSAFCEMLGYEREELAHQPTWMKLTHPDDIDETQLQIDGLLGGIRDSARFEKRYLGKNGDVIWADVHSSLRRDDSGRPLYLMTTVVDITERKRAAQYQEANREVLRILSEPGDLHESIEAIMDVLKTATGFDAVGIRLQVGEDFPFFAQDGFEDRFLLTENTLLEYEVDGSVARDDNGVVRLEGACGLVVSGKADTESPLFTRGGSFWTEDSCPLADLPSAQDPRFRPRNECMLRGYSSIALMPIRNREGIVGLVHLGDHRKAMLSLQTVELLEGIVSHIGEALMRKQAEQTIRESEERYRSILAASPDNITITDMAGQITMVSPASLEMFKLASDADALGRSITDYIAPEDVERVSAGIAQMSTGELDDRLGEYRAMCSDGSTFDLEVNAEFIRDGVGEPCGIVFIGRNVSDRKASELEVEKTAVRLEGLLEERELNLAQLAASLSSIIEVVSQVVETRDPYTAGHERRVAELAVRIAQEMGMSADEIEQIRIAALLHDVGKISVPTEILVKPGALTPMEFELVKDHAEAGARILASVEFEGPTAEMVLQHHERCDGSGYPRGLTADQILDGSKVLMVADVVEAMSSHRPYRPALGMVPALAEIKRGEGLQYDVEAAEACQRVVEAGFEFSDV